MGEVKREEGEKLFKLAAKDFEMREKEFGIQVGLFRFEKKKKKNDVLWTLDRAKEKERIGRVGFG